MVSLTIVFQNVCMKTFRDFSFTYLELLHCEIKESQIIPNSDNGLGALTAHWSTQATIQLHDYEFIKHMMYDVSIWSF